MQDEAGPPEHRAEKGREWCGRFLELGEDQRLLLSRGDFLGEVAQARELAAVLFRPCAVAEPLGRVVADLLQPHEQGKDDAAPLYAVGLFKLTGEIVHCLLVKRSLLAAERAEGLYLGLIGKIRDDALVGLQTPQNIGAHQLAQRSRRDCAAGRRAA